jgi:hypothetical protein
MRGSIGLLPIEALLWDSVGLVLPAVRSIVGGVCTPILFTKQAMLLRATFLGNPFIKEDHLSLRGVTRLGSSLGPISNLINREGSFYAFEGFK